MDNVLFSSLFILGLVSGITVPDADQGTTLGNLGSRPRRLLLPVGLPRSY